LGGKCPRCRKGSMFRYPITRLMKFNQMHECCDNCNLRFEVEPGFFYGAMYISYALSVAIFLVTTFLVYFILNDPAVSVYVTCVAVVTLILYPLNFRFSRIFYLHLFGQVKHDPNY
jgi:uncharacterized protein (DUF983 family)